MSAPVPPRRRRIWKALRVGGFLLLVWLIASWVVAYQLTRRRHRPFAEPVPSVAWAQFEAHRLRTDDGEEIGAWYAPGRDDAAPAVVLIHGNGGQRGHSLGRAELMACEAGCPLLLISLRAHGDSTGTYNDIGYGARRDVIAAVSFLERQRPGRPIVLFGSSLGAAAALFAAEELGHRVQGYILESPYQTLRIAVRNRTENELPPGLDWLAYQGLLAVAPLVLPHLDRISPHDAIARVPTDIPILILAGAEDISARRVEAEALRNRAGSHSTLHLFPRAGHLQMIRADPARYRQAVLALLREARAVNRGSPRGNARRSGRRPVCRRRGRSPSHE